MIIPVYSQIRIGFLPFEGISFMGAKVGKKGVI